MTSKRQPTTSTSSLNTATKEICLNISRKTRQSLKNKLLNSSFRFSTPSRPLSKIKSCTGISNWRIFLCMMDKLKSQTSDSASYSQMKSSLKQCSDLLSTWLLKYLEAASITTRLIFGRSVLSSMKCSSDCNSSYIQSSLQSRKHDWSCQQHQE